MRVHFTQECALYIFFYVRVCVCVKLHQGALELLMSLLSAGTGVSTRWLLSPEYC